MGSSCGVDGAISFSCAGEAVLHVAWKRGNFHDAVLFVGGFLFAIIG